eukprot:CAMPEP_0113941684 /NCGR_PEP_ID=MMETSP1339-20121228/7551_1 /TAXON_ID=94617 /ORGANISM="Fibrocapsa japonica" /LENGTH=411 /DNA_ID=CAMNT_0000945899 /DNA_START=92 /DNA_END=1324 /DNA_ORIENTATION=+ /assembly_acc=CAM_ASM_000762
MARYRDGGRMVPNISKEEDEAEPYQIYTEQADIGKHVKRTKRSVRWRFSFGEDGPPHEVYLLHSVMTQRKMIQLDGVEIHNSQKVIKQFAHAWTMGRHFVRLEINDFQENEYILLVDSRRFETLPRKGFSARRSGSSNDKPKKKSSDKEKGSSGKKKDKDRPRKKKSSSSSSSSQAAAAAAGAGAGAVAAAGRLAAPSAPAPTATADLIGGPAAPAQGGFDAFGASSARGGGGSRAQQTPNLDVFASSVGRAPASNEVLGLGMEFQGLTFSSPENLNNFAQQQAGQYEDSEDDDESYEEEEDQDGNKKGTDLGEWGEAVGKLTNLDGNILEDKPQAVGVLARAPQARPMTLKEMSGTTVVQEKKPVMLTPQDRLQQAQQQMSPAMQQQQQLMMQQQLMLQQRMMMQQQMMQ